jgi:glycosyltransferase involved in cell wall biosynthesis
MLYVKIQDNTYLNGIGIEMINPKILAIITAHDSSNVIEKAIVSLVKQDYPYLNILVIDDCSVDNTYELISKYRNKLTALRNENNSGFSFSLNLALSLIDSEEFLFLLEDDIELVNSNYITNAVRHFGDSRIALVCGNAVDFTSERLSLTQRLWARYTNNDYQDLGIKEISYSYLKADLIRVSSLKQVGGFSSAGNEKLAVEDQILAKKLRDSGFKLLRDSSLQYYLDFGGNSNLWGFLKSEANAGYGLGMAIRSKSISVNPNQSNTTKRKRNFRLGQVITVAFSCLSLLLLFYSFKLALAVLMAVLFLRFAYYFIIAGGFKWYERLYCGIMGIIDDFVFSFQFYLGILRHN